MFERRIFLGVLGSSATNGAKILLSFFVRSSLSCCFVGRGIFEINFFFCGPATGRGTTKCFCGLLINVGSLDAVFVFLLQLEMTVCFDFLGVEWLDDIGVGSLAGVHRIALRFSIFV